MDKFYQVFVSSTYDDLKYERQQVTNTLAKAGYVAAGMELFPATDQQQLEYIKRVIDRSDYYVVIVGGRYGSLAENGLSYTENEFDYAHSKGIPVLAFLHAAPGTIAVERTDDDADKKAKLEAFKQKLRSGRITEVWSNPTDLCMKVVIAVGNQINLTPRVGWVRGDQAIDPKVLQEAERLRIENADLRKKIDALSGGEIIFDPQFAGPSAEFSLDVDATQYNDAGHPVHSIVVPFKTSAQRVLLNHYNELLLAPPESSITSSVAAEIAKPRLANTRYSLTEQSAPLLRNQLEALGLIETVSNERHTLKWHLTDKAKKYALALLALKAPSENDD
jgi:hypothetical protein